MITVSWTTIIIVSVVWLFAVMIYYTGRVALYKKALRAPNFDVTQKIAESELQQFRVYLKNCMKGRPEEDRKMFDYYLKKSEKFPGSPDEAAVLIRLIHMLGCELVARQKDTKDIEVEENRGDVYWNYYTELADRHYKSFVKHFKYPEL